MSKHGDSNYIHLLFDISVIPDSKVASQTGTVLRLLQELKLLDRVSGSAALAGSLKDHSLNQANPALEKWFSRINALLRSPDAVLFSFLLCSVGIEICLGCALGCLLVSCCKRSVDAEFVHVDKFCWLDRYDPHIVPLGSCI